MNATSAISSAANAIVETRDFCGDERAALSQWMDDNGRLTVAEQIKARQEADRIWNESRIAAGVTAPVSPEEKAAIGRMMDRAA